MAKYTLSEYDIKVLIGVAANKVCDKMTSPFINDAVIMTIGSEIAMSLTDHLSGRDKFNDEVIDLAKEELKAYGIVPMESDEK